MVLELTVTPSTDRRPVVVNPSFLKPLCGTVVSVDDSLYSLCPACPTGSAFIIMKIETWKRFQLTLFTYVYHRLTR